jgi:hypothetical protein
MDSSRESLLVGDRVFSAPAGHRCMRSDRERFPHALRYPHFQAHVPISSLFPRLLQGPGARGLLHPCLA